MELAGLVGLAAAALVVVAAFGFALVPALRAFVWAGRLPGGWGALPVEDVESEEAPRGWKCAQLLISPEGGDVRLAGVAIGGLYAAEDVAVCAFNRPHGAPCLRCECGFYAFCDRADAAALLARRVGYDGQVVVRALCEVELSGTVIVCDRGYRAERQCVLQVGVLPWCADCAARGSLVRARLLGAEARPAPVPPSVASYAKQAATEAIHLTVRLRLTWPVLRPLCLRCVGPGGPSAPALTLGEAAGRLGTELRWLD
ncbi:MAG: hypothetical protein M3276_11265, partial [Actinomycetota bacterium]|nr:hypothetical protein [Actinomycetota bacterium]